MGGNHAISGSRFCSSKDDPDMDPHETYCLIAETKIKGSRLSWRLDYNPESSSNSGFPVIKFLFLFSLVYFFIKGTLCSCQ